MNRYIQAVEILLEAVTEIHGGYVYREFGKGDREIMFLSLTLLNVVASRGLSVQSQLIDHVADPEEEIKSALVVWDPAGFDLTAVGTGSADPICTQWQETRMGFRPIPLFMVPK